MEIKQSKMEYFNILSILILPIFFKMLQRKCRKYTQTEDGLTFESGILSKKVVKIKASKMEEVEVNQSILGRMLGYGTIRLNTGGNTNQEFHYIVEPKKLVA